MKKPISLLLCILLAACLFVPVCAAEGGPAETTNYAGQNYARWAFTVKSFLFENPAGGLTRVEYADDRVIVEQYDDTFNYCSGESLAMELPIWGGFFAGQNYNYLVEGQNNDEQDDSKEVIRIIQYDKDWKRIGSTGLYGANTVHPFEAGAVRFAEYGDDLYIRTCHEMYAAADGYNHQASVTIAVKQSELKITDSWYEVMNVSYGYVSHSFNQFVIVDGEQNIICADHGDAYPRSTVLIKYPVKAGNGVFSADYRNQAEAVDVQVYPGYRGDNTTGGTLGGLAGTSQGYLVAHTCDGVGGGGTQLPYLSFVDKDSLAVTTRALPFQEAACPPMLVPTGADRGYVLWARKNDSVNTGMTYYTIDRSGNWIAYTPDPEHVDDTLYYVTYQADGSFGSVQTAASAPLSDCQPIVYRGNVVWYVTEKSVPTFYVLSESGVKATLATAEERAPEVQPSAGALPFEDVGPGDACYSAVLWAYTHEPQITKGQDADRFAPEAAVKRGEAMTFLWRAMGEPVPAADAPFADLTADWYKSPVAWAVGLGVTKGTGETTFSPEDTLTTAHIVTFLYRAMNPGKDGWYAEAAAWASERGYLDRVGLPIDNETPCPRGAVVIILYNVLA
ncbi:MAG: S-layer homology domain-containing protein [Oscillospiraceae bacterium]|nr:S-layer homology domain-containing protein [Oscillospiraceae bacterium]